MSNWADATAREAGALCPKCGAMNRPGATVIEVNPQGLAFCAVCSHSFDLRRVREAPGLKGTT